MTTPAQQAWNDLLRSLDPDDLEAAVPAYVISAPDSDDVSFSDSDSWDSSDAVSGYPNPSEDDTDMAAFRSNFVFSPEMTDESADDLAKSDFKAPIRDEHAGAVNPNALKAVVSAINGARGGFDGVDQDTLEDGFNAAVRLAVDAGVYDDRSDAPDFSGSEASDQSNPVTASESFVGEAGSDESASGMNRQSVEDGLSGVIWAAGEHTVNMNNEPTTLHVPPETIEPTYERLKSRMEAGDKPSIGFDHPDSDSVAANTALGEIGKFSDIALSEDRTQIVLTDSEYTNNQAVRAAEAGSFDEYEFSIVGAIGAETTEAGERKTTDSGAIEVAAVRIDRADVVPDGAIGGPPVGVMPEVAASAGIAKRSPELPASGFAEQEGTSMQDFNKGQTFDSVEAANEAIRDATNVIEAKDEKISELQSAKEELKAQAEAFSQVAASHGVDIEADDASTQDVIDAHTESTRREIAQLEASIPKYDTEEDEIDSRAEDLTGRSINDLELRAGKLSREAYKADARRDDLGKAVTAGEQGGAGSAGGGGSGGGQANEELQEMADSALGPIEAQEADTHYDGDYVEYLREEHGVEASNHRSDMAIISTMTADSGAD